MGERERERARASRRGEGERCGARPSSPLGADCCQSWSAISAAVVGVVGGSEGSEGTKWLGAGSRRRGARPRALPSRSAGLLSYSGSRCMSQCYSGLLSTPFREVTCSSQLSSPFSRPAAMHAGPERASARPASFGRHGCTGTLHGLGPGERPK
ncbi:hypothetical protein DMC30DRAFT_398295 [Rhodotorula diobovata]|uniref:Uncharacterized protein n=1 Tax=Rhodotorula diobovata TaxID=5288 RepID=A0A5C5FWV0_9BASI|nr:hypothetical protein DMC30DRAFT_398295 [Rhodotorula diobovata]